MVKQSGNVFNIESTYYSNMRMGYYMRCGKRWLQKNRFQCFLTPKEALLWLIVFSVHLTLSLHHLSIRTDTSTMPVIHSANRLHLLCMS